MNQGLAQIRQERKDYMAALTKALTRHDVMSSFSNPHYMYLFEMKNGKKKLAYGQSPEDALNILAMRLSAGRDGADQPRAVHQDQAA